MLTFEQLIQLTTQNIRRRRQRKVLVGATAILAAGVGSAVFASFLFKPASLIFGVAAIGAASWWLIRSPKTTLADSAKFLDAALGQKGLALSWLELHTRNPERTGELSHLEQGLLKALGARDPKSLLAWRWTNREKFLAAISVICLLPLLLLLRPKVYQPPQNETSEQVAQILQAQPELPIEIKEELQQLVEELNKNPDGEEAIEAVEAALSEIAEYQKVTPEESSEPPTPTSTPTATPTPSPADNKNEEKQDPDHQKNPDQKDQSKDKNKGGSSDKGEQKEPEEKSGQGESQKQDQKDQQGGKQGDQQSKEQEKSQQGSSGKDKSEQEQGKGEGEGKSSGQGKDSKNQDKSDGADQKENKDSQGSGEKDQGKPQEGGDPDKNKEGQSRSDKSVENAAQQLKDLKDKLEKQKEQKESQQGESQKGSKPQQGDKKDGEQKKDEKSPGAGGAEGKDRKQEGAQKKEQGKDPSNDQKGNPGEKSEPQQNKQSEKPVAGAKEQKDAPSQKEPPKSAPVSKEEQEKAKARGYKEGTEAAEGLGENKGFKEQLVKQGQDAIDERYGQKTKGDGTEVQVAKPRVNLGKVELAQPEPRELREEQQIPPEYRDMLR